MLACGAASCLNISLGILLWRNLWILEVVTLPQFTTKVEVTTLLLGLEMD